MDTAVRCTCGHFEGEHVHLYDLYGKCMKPGCPCPEFVCSKCREVGGLHCRGCAHTPRHPWDKPSRGP